MTLKYTEIHVNPLMGTLRTPSNGLFNSIQFNSIYSSSRLIAHGENVLYSNTVIGTLAVDGWAVTFGITRRGLGGPPIFLGQVYTVVLLT